MLDEQDKRWISDQIRASEERIMKRFASYFENEEAKTRLINFADRSRLNQMAEDRMRAIEERISLIEQRLVGRTQ